MILQGFGHTIATFITGRYFNGFAGGYTGIGLIIAGSFLIRYLVKGIRNGEKEIRKTDEVHF